MIAALAGGVGGAKLAHGLAAYLPPEDLSVIVNTADDFELYGLRISPDLDTVMYTLAGAANPDTGWGVAGDTWAALEMIRRYGRDTWFQIGDRDLATHVLRTEQLRAGRTLTDATAGLGAALGVRSALLPMCDEPVATIVETPDGSLDFQEYFVHRHHAPEVTGLRFEGMGGARPTGAVLAALANAELIVFCPSNPLVSIGPVLAVPGLLGALHRSPAPVVAVSPIVAGRALRGPADHMLASLGHEPSAYGVAKIYSGVVRGMIIDEADAELERDIRSLGMEVLVTATVMRDEADRVSLARAAVEFGRSLARTGVPTR